MSLFRRDTLVPKKKLHLEEAHSWYQKSLETGREVSAESVRDSVEVPEVGVIESESANCDAELAKLRLQPSSYKVNLSWQVSVLMLAS